MSLPSTSPERPASSPSRTTIVVATRDRRDDLLATLARHEAPVVVVDNGSTDGTADAVENAYPQVEVVRLSGNRAAGARTIGARLATTPFVAFADDDSWWEPGALDLAEDAFDAHPQVALVAASIVVGSGDAGEDGVRPDPINDVFADSPLGDAGPGPALLGFVACAAAVRRDAFLAVGGFDDVVVFPGEEERVALDLDHAGWRLAYLPEAVVRHVPATNRDADEDRQRGLLRSRLVTALLRLPWRHVAARAWQAARSPRGRRALLEAIPRVPEAMARRRVVGPGTVARLERLRNAR